MLFLKTKYALVFLLSSLYFAFRLGCCCSSHSVGGVLQHNHCEFFIWRNHNLVDSRPDFDEGDVLLRVQLLDGVRGLVQELRDQTSVVDRLILLHRALNRHTFLVDDDDAEDAHVRVDAVQRLLHLLRRCHLSQF